MDDPKLVDALAHADPEQWPTILERTTDRMTGHYGKDPGWALVRSALDAMRRAEPHPTLLMVLGDFLAHRFRPQFDANATDHSDAAFRDFVRKTMAFMTQELSRRFPTTPIVAAIGNDDDVCGDYRRPGGPFLKDTLPIVRRMLDGEIPDGFDAGWTATGNYSVGTPLCRTCASCSSTRSISPATIATRAATGRAPIRRTRRCAFSRRNSRRRERRATRSG